MTTDKMRSVRWLRSTVKSPWREPRLHAILENPREALCGMKTRDDFVEDERYTRRCKVCVARAIREKLV